MIVRPHSLLLDAEALSALAGDDRSMQAWATFAKRSDAKSTPAGRSTSARTPSAVSLEWPYGTAGAVGDSSVSGSSVGSP